MLHRIRKQHRIMVSYTTLILRSLGKPIYLFLVFASLTMMFFGASVIFYVEHGQNPGINTYFDAFYFIVTTMTGVGFGDIVPRTTFGRSFTMAFMLLGTAIYVAFTAVFATTLIDAEYGAKEGD